MIINRDDLVMITCVTTYVKEQSGVIWMPCEGAIISGLLDPEIILLTETNKGHQLLFHLDKEEALSLGKQLIKAVVSQEKH